MLNTAETLKTYFSSFDLPAYMSDSVPDNVELPYITYPLIEPEFGEQASFYANVWYPKKKLANLLAKADQITADIGTGAVFQQANGYIAIYPSVPLVQILTEDDAQRAYLNLIIKAFHNPGE